MITLQQAKKVRFGCYLTEEDVEFINRYNGGLKLAECWAAQYAFEARIEMKKDKDFRRNAYGE